MTKKEVEKKIEYWKNQNKIAEGEYKKLCLKQIKEWKSKR